MAQSRFCSLLDEFTQFVWLKLNLEELESHFRNHKNDTNFVFKGYIFYNLLNN